MATPRGKQVDPEVTRWYHCISKCVRNAFLLSDRPGITDRKEWIQNRIEELCEVFAIAVAGFAILDNHVHLLTRLDPDMAREWSDEEVARRWGRLHPPRDGKRRPLPISKEWIREKVKDADWVAKTREKLQSLSWFMKSLKEPLSRLANKEDGCEGAFFVGRFKSIAILDVIALLEVCVYLDLNLLAAGISRLPEESVYTSLYQRIAHTWPHVSRDELMAALRGQVASELSGTDHEQSHWLCPINDRRRFGSNREGMIEGLTLLQYLLIVDDMSRVQREGKACVSPEVAPIFERLGVAGECWQEGMAQLLERLSRRKWVGRVFATSREALQAAKQQFGLHHLVNLGGTDHLLDNPAAPGTEA